MPTIDWSYAHLLINHFPIVLSILGLVTALAALLLRRRGLWLYAMGTLTAAALAVYPANFSGEQAEHALHDPWYVQHDAVEAHEEAAEPALIIILFTGAVSLYGWWRAVRRREEAIPVWIRTAVLVGALAGTGSVAYAGFLGGKIIHEAPVLGLPTAPPGLPPGIASPPRNSGRPSD